MSSARRKLARTPGRRVVVMARQTLALTVGARRAQQRAVRVPREGDVAGAVQRLRQLKQHAQAAALRHPGWTARFTRVPPAETCARLAACAALRVRGARFFEFVLCGPYFTPCTVGPRFQTSKR